MNPEIGDLIARGRALLSQGSPELMPLINTLAAQDSWAAVSAVAEFCLEMERPAKAMEALTPYLARHSAEATACSLQGDLLSALGRAEEALASYEKAVDLDPSPQHRDQRLCALVSIGHRDEAIALLEEDVRRKSLTLVGHHLLAVFQSDTRLRLEEVVRIGDPVRIVPFLSLNSSPKGFFKSRIEDMQGSLIQVSYPTAPGATFPWSGPNRSVLLVSFHEDKYFGTETVILRRLRAPIPTIELSQPREMNRIQRRGSLRLSIPLIQGLKWQSRPAVSFSTTNMCIGGAMVAVSGPPPGPKDRLTCVLELEPGKPVTVNASVIRVDSTDGTGTHQVALKFDDLKAIDSERLAKRIFQHQMALRRKAL